MVDTHLLRYYVQKNGDTVESLAEHLEIGRGALSAKMNNRRDFKLTEVIRITRKYKLTNEQVISVFCKGCEHFDHKRSG